MINKFLTPPIAQAAPVELAPPHTPACSNAPEQQFLLDLDSEVEGEREEDYEGVYGEGGRMIVI